MKAASLLAVPGGKVLVLSSRGTPIDVPSAEIDMVARVYSPAGAQLAARGIAPIIKSTYGAECSVFAGHAIVAQDGQIWVLASVKDGSGLEGAFLIRFSAGLDVGATLFLRGAIEDFFGEEITTTGWAGAGLAPNVGSGVIATLRTKLLFWNGSFESSSSVATYAISNGGGTSFLNDDGDSLDNDTLFRFGEGFDQATSGANHLTSFAPVSRNSLTFMGCDLGVDFSGTVLDFQANSYGTGLEIEAVPGGKFLVAGYEPTFGGGHYLAWGEPNLSSSVPFEQAETLLLPLVGPSGWVLSSLRTDTQGTGYLAGGPTVGGKESIGISVDYDPTASFIKAGITWQLTNSSGTFSAKRILPTAQNRVFAVGVNPAGVVGVQLFQQPTYYRGITLSATALGRGATAYYKLRLAAPAPAGGYRVAVTASSSRFSGIPSVVTVPEGTTFVEGSFTVRASAPLGDTTITTRVDSRYDTVNAIHTATANISD